VVGLRNEYKVFIGKNERKKPLGRLGQRWKHNIKGNLK
jgi:hypothetical protein